VAGFAASLLAGNDAHSSLTPTAGRLVSLRSNRYEYWKVAGRAFAGEPLRGVGAGGWAVRWRRERPFNAQARNAHSLYFGTAAELGLVGLALLAAWLAGVALAARDALRAAPEAAAGLVAVVAVWAAHVALDWDFELPAATLPALLAAGALLALAEESYRASATRGASRRKIQTANAHTAT
jgi:O-antigen ligase